MTVFTNRKNGRIGFADSSSACYATFTNAPAGSDTDRAVLSFGDNSTADHSNITNLGVGVIFGPPKPGGMTFFSGSATAGDSVITTNGGTTSVNTSEGTLRAAGGTTEFAETSPPRRLRSLQIPA
jgi:hypothetical protein